MCAEPTLPLGEFVQDRTSEPDHVRLTVMDSGIGFDAQDTELLFGPFYSTKGAGMGIGLCVWRSIIERFCGRLCAMRNDGPGASFEFSIPCFSNEIAGAYRHNAIQAATNSSDIGTQLSGLHADLARGMKPGVPVFTTSLSLCLV
jgi:hypothetical protein